MPAIALDNTLREVRRFYVVGTRSEARPSWVLHAALLRTDRHLRYGDVAFVYHICPPLHLGPGTLHYYPHPLWPPGHLLFDNPVQVHVIGFVEGLTDADVYGIETWIAHLSTQTPTVLEGIRLLDQYVMCPPIRRTQRDTVTGIREFIQFSCVGFVLDCYFHGAGISLLDWESPDFPRIDLAELMTVYNVLLANPDNRRAVGLTDAEERWPVPLPGHLFHSLRRPAHEIRSRPYLPRSSAEVFFPSQAIDPLTAVEHAEARVIAYYYAWDRGGGREPPYDPGLSAEDFCRAEADVISRRPH